jgi:hypothetical protein
MPVTCGHKDSKGTYCIWGGHGAHYYYTPGNEDSMKEAQRKAAAQGAAAHANGYQGSEDDLLENDVPHASGNNDKDRRKRPKTPNEDEPGDERDPGDEGDYKPEGGRDSEGGRGTIMESEIMKKLPDVHPNEDEQTYVSRCIAFETEHSTHDRPPEQISRMCYEKYRTRGQKSQSPYDIASDTIDKIALALESLKKNLIP